ncbi:MAG TPA: tannase/feruloyl esterase family alpha/beta hydrolase [Steroidobacteraceae bacterium]|nr:tannase/feruloyl esterase family alpha/beta hydrolase [Steroidobacteraceae bacterium]
MTAPAANRAQTRTVRVADLDAICRPQIVQAAVSKLSPAVTVHELPKEEMAAAAMPGGTHFVAASRNLPAFCQVSGSFVTDPKTGKTANFLATFPAQWNGKYLQLGCSGHCGQFAVSNAATPSVTITTQGYPGEIISKGYASIATDEGHAGFSGGLWAIKGPGRVDEDAIEDFYYRADEVLTRVGKQVTLAFYDRATNTPQKLSRSYFSGCSGGGRDAFVAASYFPEEFDGIIGGSAYNLVGASLQFAGVALATLRSADADVPPALIARIDPIVKAQCDKLDGVEDGLIQNPAACGFRPERDLPRCDGKTAADQCFTQAQVETISTLLTAVTDEDGHVVQPGFSVSEVQDAFRMPNRPKDLAAADPWPNADTDNPTATGPWPLANATIKIFIHKNDPDFNTRSLFTFKSGGPGPITDYHIVVPKAQVARALAEARMGIGHFPQNAAELIKLNRKFLIWTNLSDQRLTPYMSINYYKQLAQMHGGYAKLQHNVRLFGIPDSSHCSITGVGPDNFDALTAMEDWVEKGKAPDALLAKLYDPKGPDVDPGKTPLRTMPLCKFPEMAHYSGRGDVKDAANWSCPAGDTSMLRIGESGKQAGVVE